MTFNTNAIHDLNISRLALVLVFVIMLQGNMYSAVIDKYLESALIIAQDGNEKLKAAKEQIELAKIRVLKVKRDFLPALLAERKFARGKAFRGELFEEQYQSEEFGLRASQPLFEGWRLSASYGYNKLLLDVAKANYTKNRDEIFYDVRTAYYTLLAAKMKLNELKNLYTEISAYNEKSKKEYKATAISQLEMSESENLKDKVESSFTSAEMELSLSQKRLALFLFIKNPNNLPPTPERLSEEVEDIPYVDDCIKIAIANNPELKINELYKQMSQEKKIINRSKVIPKVYIDGFYGKSGEAFVTEPLKLVTVWSVIAKVSWGLWGSSAEASRQQEKAIPREIMDVSQRTDTESYNFKLSIFDDLNYFVESKETRVEYVQSDAKLKEIMDKLELTTQEQYNRYLQTLTDIKITRREIDISERKLEVLRKRNSLYEIPTLDVMKGIWSHVETIMKYSKGLLDNYIAICELKKLTSDFSR